MKQTCSFWRIAAILVIFGLSLTGCPGTSGDDDVIPSPPEVQVTAGLYQKAPPIQPGDTPIAGVTANNVDAAVTYAKANAAVDKAFTLLIDDDATMSYTVISNGRFNLYIQGLGGMRTIRYTGPNDQYMFRLAAANSRLTLYENITLRGNSTSSLHLINIEQGTLNMNNTTKITGHTSPRSVVRVQSGLLNMAGGEISGNQNTSTDANAVGGVTLDTSASIVMTGGSINGNTTNFVAPGTAYDIFVAHRNEPTHVGLQLSGAAEIGSLVLYTNSPSSYYYSVVQVNTGWTGRVNLFHLLGFADTVTEAIDMWYISPPNSRKIIYGTASDIGKFTRGAFLATGSTDRVSISSNYYIGTSGDDIGKLLKY